MRAGWLLVALAAAPGAHAQPPQEGVQWLQKMFAATQRLSFSGTFIYQHGPRMETSRIVRVVDASGSHERLEVLDGTPREVVRHNDEVICYLPDTMTMKVDKKTVARPFPGLTAENVQDLGEHYTIRKGDVWRVAGMECQSIILEPKDTLRYGQRLCADLATGMVLKAQTVGERNDVIEQFAFTEIKIGGVDRERLKSKFSAKGKDWRIEQSDMSPANFTDLGWTFKAVPPGYRKVVQVKGRLGSHPDVGQIVLSDGLAAVSVFIEPVASKAETVLGPSRQGATNLYSRKVDEYMVTVVGEAPTESVKAIAEGVAFRKPQ